MKARPLTYAEVIDGVMHILRNAENLISEAKLLYEANRIPRAYTLSHLAREELAKIPMLFRVGAQILAGTTPDWRNFWKRFRDHKAKIRNDLVVQAVATSSVIGDAAPELLEVMVATVDLRNDRKNNSLYVSFSDTGFASPDEAITAEVAARTIHLAEYTYLDALPHLETLRHLSTLPQSHLREGLNQVERFLNGVDPKKRMNALFMFAAMVRSAVQKRAESLGDEQNGPTGDGNDAP